MLDHITEQFELAGLPVPQTYTKSVDSVCHRVNKFTTDKTGNFKKEVEASCELVAYVLALRGIDTKKGLLAAIATASAPATPPATDAPTAAPPAGGSGHDKSGPQSANNNRYVVIRTLKSKETKDGKKATAAAEKQENIDVAAAEALKLQQLEAAQDKAKLERIAAADNNRLGFKRVGKEAHNAAVLDQQFEGLRKKLEMLRTKLSEEKIVPIYEPVKHVSASGCSTTSLSARPSFMEMMRILTAECGVKPNQLNLVCNVVYAALFERGPRVGGSHSIRPATSRSCV